MIINKNWYRGVRRLKSGRWFVHLEYNHQRYKLGTFDKLVDAINAHDNKALELYGDKAITNKDLIERGLLPTPTSQLDRKYEIVNNLNDEIWSNIPDFKYYQVSNKGRVKSLDRERKNRWNTIYIQPGRLLIPNKNIDGYLMVKLKNKTYRRCISVHRLVAQAFIPNLENKPEVNHKNFNKTDNRVENLQWSTGLENVTHFHKYGDVIILRGSQSHSSKLNEEQVLEIRRMAAAKELPNTRIALRYNVTSGAIDAIVHRRTWTHI